MTVVSIAIAGEVLAARYIHDGHTSDLDPAIHAVEMELKVLPLIHPKRPYASQNYSDRPELKMRASFAGRDQRRAINLLRRWSFEVSESSRSQFDYLTKGDLLLIKNIVKRD